jgi:hypothetical protein
MTMRLVGDVKVCARAQDAPNVCRHPAQYNAGKGTLPRTRLFSLLYILERLDCITVMQGEEIGSVPRGKVQSYGM